MNRKSRTVWLAQLVLGWIAVVALAHVVSDALGVWVFLVSVTALVLWRVVPRLPGLLTDTAEGIERQRRRWRYARADVALAFTWPAWLKFLWYVAALLGGVSAVLGTMAHDGFAGEVVAPTAWTFLMLVATLDLLSMVRVGLRRASGKAVGVVVASVGTAVVAAVALSFARKTIFAWMGEDPAAFPASLTLFTAVLVPMGWLGVLAGLSAVLMVPMMFASLWQMGNTRRIDREGSFYAFLVSLRPVFVCAVPVVLMTHLWSWHGQDWPCLRHAGRNVVVALDYWERPICGGVRGLANRLDDEHYSVVTGGQKQPWRFTTVQCTPGHAQ